MKLRDKIFFGFSLIEVIVTIGFVSIFLTAIGSFLADASFNRKEAADLNRAMFLASQKMDEIKNLKEDASDAGDFEQFPGMRYEYEVINKKEDLVSFFSEDREENEGSEKSDQISEFLEEQGRDRELSTGLEFAMRYFVVIIYYGHEKKYRLDYFRGENVSTR
ncbi:MAG: type II secretion system protein [Leptospirales bacterium]